MGTLDLMHRAPLYLSLHARARLVCLDPFGSHSSTPHTTHTLHTKPTLDSHSQQSSVSILLALSLAPFFLRTLSLSFSLSDTYRYWSLGVSRALDPFDQNPLESVSEKCNLTKIENRNSFLFPSLNHFYVHRTVWTFRPNVWCTFPYASLISASALQNSPLFCGKA